HPASIAVHKARPEGSPRNAWPTTVERVEGLGSRVRLRTGPLLSLTVELTEAARSEMAIEPGSPIWVAVKATEIGVQPDGWPGGSTHPGFPGRAGVALEGAQVDAELPVED